MEFKFLTVQEIADILKLNIITVYEYIRQGKLKSMRFGRSYRVLVEDFQEFLESQKLK